MPDALDKLRFTNPAAYKTVLSIAELLTRKSEDYSPTAPFGSFIEASLDAGADVDSVFRVMIGVKTARERALLESKNEPNFESLQDTRLDRAAYCILQCAYHSSKEG